MSPAGKPRAVILSPTRELAQQIAGDLEHLAQFLPGVRVVCVYGGAGMDKQQRQLKAGCQVVVATPGRLMDHYRHKAVDLSAVETIVLDEADEMLNMGFYKDVRHIIDLLKNRKSLSMFSATISREVLDIGWLYQRNAAEVSVQPVEESSPKIDQYKLLTTGRDKLADLAQLIISEGYRRVMVFCNTKYTTGMLANQLARLNFNVDCLHGDLSQAERNRIMQRFKAGEDRGACRHRRRGARHRRVRRRRGHQLRRAGRKRALYPPHRPHRPRQKGRRELPVLHQGRTEACRHPAAPDPQPGAVPQRAL